jgi:tRNA threonylcarbamoyl adenosine modification protein YeaZ
MRILAIDTALEACAAGVVETPDRVLAQESAAMARGHAEALMPLLARVMDQASLRFHHLDRIGVTVGPGSFTGLRVGIAAARGIALASGKPAVGVSTLAAFASPYLAAGEKQTVAAVVDARHDHVYFEMFGPGGRILITPRLIPVQDAVRSASGAAVLVGSGVAVLAGAWPEGTPRPAIETQAAPQITAIARLGAAADAGRALPKPLYLRPPDARPQDAARLPRR